MNKYHLVTGIIAILAVVCFFHIDSYVADKHNINLVFIIGGIVLALWAAYRVYYMSKGSGGEN